MWFTISWQFSVVDVNVGVGTLLCSIEVTFSRENLYRCYPVSAFAKHVPNGY